jgi:hypothetical protein
MPIAFFKNRVYNTCMKRVRVAVIFALLLLAVAAKAGTTSAQSEGARYFPETGHWVSGDFLVAYEKASDPIKLYGYPITAVIDNPTTNRKVQYFQRAHFELHPENPPELRVQMTHLGEIMYKAGDVLPFSQNHPACQYFPETNRQVCYAFLDFFDKNGGIAQFGYPISDIELRNERIVQCFQMACYEWHPELPSGQRVTLMDLGRLYFEARKENPRELLPDRENYIPKTTLKLQVRAFPEKAVVSKNNEQTIHVIVQDQNLLPISNAKVALTIQSKNGEQVSYTMPETDINGTTYLSYPVEQKGFGMVKVTIKVNYDIFEVQTRTSYRLWW